MAAPLLDFDTLSITEPGVYDIPVDVYHADPVPGGSLSSTGARKLLSPSCPALFRYEQQNPPPPRSAFDLGHAAHQLVLGSGPEIVAVEADDWRTKAARAQRDAAHAAGAVPLLPDEYQQVQNMAAAIRQHPIAGALFDPDRGGQPEQSLFWQDRHTGTSRRARLDWLPASSGGRLIVSDYKTTVSAEPEAIERSVHKYGYHQQADWYLDGVYELGLTDDAAFVFVFQEKTAPYLVTVVELDQSALQWGAELNRHAINVYKRCVDTGRWPGYSDDVLLTSLPVWAERGYERAQERGDYDIKETQR